MIIDETEFNSRNIVKLVKGTVVPRPIAWVSTISEEGVANLAPFSFFTVASLNPIVFCFSAGPGSAVGKEGDKDTLANIRSTEELVINIVSENQANAMHKSSLVYSAEINEFEEAGLIMATSTSVTPPCVQDAPVNMECRLDRIIPVGINHLILAELACYHIRDDVYLEGDKVNYEKLQPIGRMAGDYSFVRQFFSLPNSDLPNLLNK